MAAVGQEPAATTVMTPVSVPDETTTVSTPEPPAETGTTNQPTATQRQSPDPPQQTTPAPRPLGSASQTTSSLLDPVLGLSVPPSVSLSPLALGQTSSGSVGITVTATDGWTLQVSAGTGGDGRFAPSGCGTGAPSPANRLWVQGQRNP